MKYGRALLGLLLLSACAAGNTSEKSKKSSKDKNKDNDDIKGKIVGGKSVDITSIPYMASVSRAPSEHFCGGSIVHPNYILTAAHCVHAVRPSTLFVRTGSTTVNRGGQVTGVKNVITFPKYNMNTVEYDVALLETKTPITTGAIILIADFEPTPGLWALVTGWGVSRETSKTPMTTVQAVWMPTLDRASCARSYSTLNKVTTKMICAGFSAGGSDACQGDSGGPMVVGERQAGVVSWGRGCARKGSPGIYVNLADKEINTWIHRYIGYDRY